MSNPETQIGWSVAIRRDDGSEFLCCSDRGVLGYVWTRSQRKYATIHKRELVEAGFQARVVKVAFTRPEQLP